MHESTEPDLREALVSVLRAARSTEVTVLGALDPMTRDAPGPDRGWSPKDVQAHLSAWRRIQIGRLVARRIGTEEPAAPAAETDAANAILHAERAAWTWKRVLADADETTQALIDEVEAAADTVLADGRAVGTILGNGTEHSLAHLPGIAAGTHLDEPITDLATAVEVAIGQGTWPARATAFAYYNLACFFALREQLDRARPLLRQALLAEPELRALAPTDDDLVALRSELQELSRG
ncbi:MAG: hypothetical protein ABI598_02890 [Chloroflexota bacterium]